MSIIPREAVLTAMRLEDPGYIPGMSQLTIGHILLNTGVDPIAFNFTNDGYVEGVLKIRELYDFDGILLHKPGREEAVLRMTEVIEHEDGPALLFPDGGKIICQRNDDPKYEAPDGWQFPGAAPTDAADPLEWLEENLDWDNPIGHLPESYQHWHIHKGLHFWTAPEQIPDYYYATIDRVLAACAGKYSVHGEVKAPSDYLLNMFGMENALMAMILNPALCHKLLERATESICLWAVEQVKRGCDAIKNSSPYAGGGFLSREHYEEFVMPYEKKLAQAVREAGGFIYTHTCGAIGDRLDLIVQSGVNGIECLDPPPLGNTDLAEAKEKWGKQIFIKGNVDSVNVLLRGNPDLVREDVRRRLEIGSAGGGYIMSTACSIAPAVPPQHIKLMVEVTREFSEQRLSKSS